ncbi:hypothetical protein GCM10010404_81210 [Nonomuraea africana]|uniref:Uncharacterized protein n=1 Tax=Nonomuraea africana TaxID=46171 RepID=A0ABR9KXK9_9ACTN|nr:hypothetical protein [Nonomuraea africana]MBE1566501.1 hypothetical protein [Nonomuraea africana]
MTTIPAVNLIQPTASRDEIIAHLDASSEWQRSSETETSSYTWRLTLPSTDPYSRVYTGGQSVSVRLPAPGMYERLGSHYVIAECAEATHIINAVALRMSPDTDCEVVERIAAAYQQLDPSHPAALILSGQVEARDE